MGWSFRKKRTDCNRDDVRFLHLLCLGREPEHESEYVRFDGGSYFAALKGTISSHEFIRGALEPLMMGKALAYLPYSEEQSTFIKRLSKRHFDTSITATHRTEALIAAARAPRFLKALEAGRFPLTCSEFSEALLTSNTESPRKIVGRIEQVTSESCTGFAFSVDGTNSPLALDVYINGAFVGSCRADGTRGDIAEKYNSTPACGFHLPIRLPAHLARLEQLAVSVFEHQSGIPACPPRDFPNVGVTYQPHLLQLIHALEKATPGSPEQETALKTIQDALPAIHQYSAFPVSAYSDFAALFAPQKPEGTPGGQDLPLTHADWLRPTKGAEAWFALAAADNPKAVLFFADHEELDAKGRRVPVCKASFDYDELLTRADYAEAFAIRPEALEKLGLQNASQAEIWFRVFEAYGPDGFCHVPEILFTATQAKPTPDMHTFGEALTDHFTREGVDAAIELSPLDRFAGPLKSYARIKWPIDPSLPKLAIIIPMRDGLDMSRACVESLRETLRYPDQSEILIVDNGSEEAETRAWLAEQNDAPGTKVLRHDAPFNWAELNNMAAHDTDAGYLLFLNNDTKALEKGWDHILRGYLARQDIGAIGARLLFEDGSIQHAGVVLNDISLATHEGSNQHPVEGGYRDRTKLPHQCAAVTGAFLACRKADFETAGGFDAENFAVAFNDIDFCLKISGNCQTVLYAPEITFVHYESKSRGYDALDIGKAERARGEHERMREKWAATLNRDPFYPKAFLPQGFAYSYLAVPMRTDIKPVK